MESASKLKFRGRILRHKFQQFRRLPSADRGLLLRIAFLVPLIEIGLRIAGFKRVLTPLRKFAVAVRPAAIPAAEVERHTRLLLLFHRQLPFTGRCLARALALWYLLQRRGIATEVRLGIRKHKGQFSAHAWVEYGAQSLEPAVRLSYQAFAAPIFAAAIRAS